jgi:PmbA protein
MEKVKLNTFESKLNELNKLADKAVELGTNLGASQIEVVVSSGFARSLEFKNSSMTGIQQQSKNGIKVRAYIGKKLGMATSSSLGLNTIEDTVKDAVKLAELSPEDEHFHSLPGSMEREVVQINDLFDVNLATFDPEDFVVDAQDMIQGAGETHDKAIIGGKLNIDTIEKVTANSLGVTNDLQGSYFSGYTMVSIPLEPTNVGVGFEFFANRNLADKKPTFEIGQIAGEKAKKMLNAKNGPTGDFPVILDHRSTRNSIGSLVGMGVNGFSVMMKTSYYADKIGEDVAGDKLNVWDDPHVHGGMGSKSVDEEGVPTQRINLIENGILNSYVTDSYTAHRLGVENTGSASAGFGKIPRPNVAQIQISGGSDSLEAMLEDLKEGLYLESTVGGMFNRGSPNISNKVDRGFYVKDGEIQYPLKNTMLGTNVFEFLKGIKGISKDVLVEFGSQSPAIMVDSVSIGGADDQQKKGPQITMSSF